jgi:peptidoglycan/xylan/chitin deacetylase (PgdA/CDA1 family)
MKNCQPFPNGRVHLLAAVIALVLLIGGCQTTIKQSVAPQPVQQSQRVADTKPMVKVNELPANELGMIPVLEYHHFGAVEERWTRTFTNFRKDLEWLYNNDYVAIKASDMASGQIDIPAGKKPVVLTFDDSDAEQLRFAKTADGKIERNAAGQPILDSNCAVAIMDAFSKEHPDFTTAATFYVLPGAFQTPKEAGEKLRYLVDTGREIGNHTFHHSMLSKLSPQAIVDELSKAQAEVARAMGRPYRLQTLALPNGKYPRSEAGIQAVIQGGSGDKAYHHSAVMMVGAGPAPSPFDKRFDRMKVARIQAIDGEFNKHFNREPGSTARVTERFTAFVSDGDPKRVTFPQKLQAQLNEKALKGRTATPYHPDAVAKSAATESKAPPPATSLVGTVLAASAPQPVKVHPGYGLPLPEGGEWLDGRIIHAIQKGQSPTFLAERYLKFATHYTRPELEKAILAKNNLKRPMVSIGQRLEIPDIRKAPPVAKTVPVSKTFEAKGIYLTMTSASTERVFTLVNRMKPLGLNTVVFDVKDMDGIVSYRTQAPLALKTGASKNGTIRDLPKLIEWLHNQGIHVAARQVLFHDKWTAQHEPRLALKSKSTGKPWLERGKQVWVDPNNREVQEYNIALAKELAGMGIDEIQFDYIRFPAMGNTHDIAYSFDPEATPKHTIITDFLKRAYEALHPTGILVSIDVYGVVAWEQEIDVKITGQRIEDLAKYADIICPMVYPSHFYGHFDGFSYPAWEPYYFVSQGVARTAKKTAGTGIVIRPWLQAFPFLVKNRFTPEYVLTQLRAARDAHSIGWSLWDAQNEFNVGFQGVSKWNGLAEKTPAAEVKIAKSGG